MINPPVEFTVKLPPIELPFSTPEVLFVNATLPPVVKLNILSALAMLLRVMSLSPVVVEVLLLVKLLIPVNVNAPLCVNAPVAVSPAPVTTVKSLALKRT